MTGPDPHAALVEHRDRIAAEPRPSRLAEPAPGTGGADTWRVYCHEWVTVHTEAVHPSVLGTRDGAGLTPEAAACRQFFVEHYQDRIRPHHSRIDAQLIGGGGIVQLQLFKPNLRAEFKTRELAEGYVAEQGLDAVVVERNSRADHDLRAYGVRRLPHEERAR